MYVCTTIAFPDGCLEHLETVRGKCSPLSSLISCHVPAHGCQISSNTTIYHGGVTLPLLLGCPLRLEPFPCKHSQCRLAFLLQIPAQETQLFLLQCGWGSNAPMMDLACIFVPCMLSHFPLPNIRL